jgi:DNA end-binding protein Ku
MYSAIDQQDVHFHLLHTKDNGRVGYEKVCKKDGKPVPDDELARAYEVSQGKYVYMTEEDFEAAAGAAYHTIDLSDFVPYEQIDPIYFESTFFLGPGKGAEKVYALLVKALERSGLVGVGMFVMREKQQLGCVRVRDGVLTLERMYFADEIRSTTGIRPSRVSVAGRELEMAEELIERFSGSFDIGKYRDDYRKALLAMIKAKEKGKSVEVSESEKEEPPDLLEALQASLAERKRGGAAPRRRTRTSSRRSRSRAAR